jgi:LmbE family N-acetylglucosaminyl deacetylase
VLELCAEFGVAHPTLTEAFGPGPWLLVSPHDDDFLIGFGLGAALAVQEGIEVHAAVLTDGALGYVTLEERAGLVETRRAELKAGASLVGVEEARLHRFELPDGGLINRQGCHGDAPTSAQRLVGLLRTVRPRAVFVCTPTDTHPDHRAAASETAIALVWASSRIWLELGEPIEAPALYYYAVYQPFDGAPEYEVRGTDEQLDVKLQSIAAFASQGVVEPLLERLRADGAYEYVKRAQNEPYRPRVYRKLFERAER